MGDFGAFIMHTRFGLTDAVLLLLERRAASITCCLFSSVVAFVRYSADAYPGTICMLFLLGGFDLNTTGAGGPQTACFSSKSSSLSLLYAIAPLFSMCALLLFFIVDYLLTFPELPEPGKM